MSALWTLHQQESGSSYLRVETRSFSSDTSLCMQEPVSCYIHIRILYFVVPSGWVGLTETVCCLWSGRSAQILQKSCNQKHYCPSHSTSHQPGLSTHWARKMPCTQSSRLQLAARLSKWHSTHGSWPLSASLAYPESPRCPGYSLHLKQMPNDQCVFIISSAWLLIRASAWLDQRLDVNRFSCWGSTRPIHHRDLKYLENAIC